jgi:hypothetical protein
MQKVEMDGSKTNVFLSLLQGFGAKQVSESLVTVETVFNKPHNPSRTAQPARPLYTQFIVILVRDARQVVLSLSGILSLASLSWCHLLNSECAPSRLILSQIQDNHHLCRKPPQCSSLILSNCNLALYPQKYLLLLL